MSVLASVIIRYQLCYHCIVIDLETTVDTSQVQRQLNNPVWEDRGVIIPLLPVISLVTLWAVLHSSPQPSSWSASQLQSRALSQCSLSQSRISRRCLSGRWWPPPPCARSPGRSSPWSRRLLKVADLSGARRGSSGQLKISQRVVSAGQAVVEQILDLSYHQQAPDISNSCDTSASMAHIRSCDTLTLCLFYVK